MTTRKQTVYALVATLLLGAWATATAQAAGFSWSGSGGDGLWTTTNNWTLTSGTDDDDMPDGNDDVTFPTGPTYTGGITLNGNQACNSLTYATLVGFDLKAPGNTLTVTSGTITRTELTGTEAKHGLICNLTLTAPSGTNLLAIAGDENYGAPDQGLVCYATVTAAGGRIRKTGRGLLSLRAPTAFGGTPIIENGIIDIYGSAGSFLGSASEAIALGNGGRLYVHNSTQTITNPFVCSGGGTALIASYGCTVTLAGNITLPSGMTLQFGNSSSSLLVLQNTIGGPGHLAIMRAAVAFNSTSQFTTGNLNVGTAGGIMILDGLSWTAFTNHYSSGYGTGNRQWQSGGGGFAARTTPVLVAGSGAVGGGLNAKSWFTKMLGLGGGGYSLMDNAARLHANARVVSAVNTELAARQDFHSCGIGPGLTGTHDETYVNRFDGNITDQVAAGTGSSRGIMRMLGKYPNDELVLAGTNDWTGSYCNQGLYVGATGTYSLNTGRGGTALHIESGNTMLMRFDGQAAMPRGNGGAAAWLAAVSRYNGTQGYLFTAKTSGENYFPLPGYRFVLGTNNGGTIGILGASGASGTSATLRDSVVCLHSGQSADTAILELFVRGPVVFELGAAGSGTNGAVVFQPTYNYEAAQYDSGIAGPATTVLDATGTRTIRMRGDGTAVLRHVEYTKLDGATATTSQFKWYLGTAAGATFLEGALRETGIGPTNSTAAFPLYLQGGVLELGAADFARNVAATPTAGQISFYYGGGFAAHGADRQVNVSSGALFDWANIAVGYIHGAFPLMFGSRTANATVIFVNPIRVKGSATPFSKFATIRGNGSGPEGRLTGQISGTDGMELNALTTRAGQAIPPGTLELSHGNNTFSGAVNVNAGTLLVSGGISNGTAAVTVAANATLGGAGVIKRPVTVQTGGRLAPGNQALGTLTISGNLTLATGAVLACDLTPSANDLVKVSGTLTLPAAATVDLSVTGGTVTGRRVLIDGTSAPAQTDLSGWSVTGVANTSAYRIEVRGNDVVLRGPDAGTAVLVR